jgi:predicted anti-sigma-YlaC factor YlaD
MMIVCGTCGNFRDAGSGEVATNCIDCRTWVLRVAALSQDQEARARDREIGRDEARHERAAEWLREIGR